MNERGKEIKIIQKVSGYLLAKVHLFRLKDGRTERSNLGLNYHCHS